MDRIKAELTRLLDIATSEMDNKYELFKEQKKVLLSTIQSEIDGAYEQGKSTATDDILSRV